MKMEFFEGIKAPLCSVSIITLYNLYGNCFRFPAVKAHKYLNK